MNLVKKSFIFTLIIISIFLLSYTFYKSEIYWVGLKRGYYLLYYIISISLILFSITLLFISEKIKSYAITIFLSFVMSIYLFEAYLISNVKEKNELNKKIKIYKELTGNNFDTRTPMEIFKDLSVIETNISLAIPPIFFLNKKNKLFPLSRLSNSKTILANENGYYSIYLSDRYGFNNPDHEWSENEIEYLLVGDSFAHGSSVNRPNDIASVLRILSKKSVLNLGYMGNGPLLEYSTLREYLKPNVKNILWLFYEGNDIGNINDELKSKILKKYLTDLKFTQNLKHKQKQINKIVKKIIIEEKHEKNFKEQKKKINYISFIRIEKFRAILNNVLPNKLKYKEKIKPEFKKIISLANDLAKKNGSNFYFVYIPEYIRYKINYKNETYGYIKQIVLDLNIPFIDIDEKVFAKESNPLKLFPFEMYGHYNIEGYSKTAKAIHEFVSTN